MSRYPQDQYYLPQLYSHLLQLLTIGPLGELQMLGIKEPAVLAGLLQQLLNMKVAWQLPLMESYMTYQSNMGSNVTLILLVAKEDTHIELLS